MAPGPGAGDGGHGGNPWTNWSAGLAISMYLLAGPAVWGGVGWLVDRLVGTGKLFTAIGMVVGAAAGIYLVYLRYGRADDDRKP